jgi:hypothetical protein
MLFHDCLGCSQAMTMLDATAEANNRTALQESLDYYKAQMARVVGEDCDFIKEVMLEVQWHFILKLLHQLCRLNYDPHTGNQLYCSESCVVNIR